LRISVLVTAASIQIPADSVQAFVEQWGEEGVALRRSDRHGGCTYQAALQLFERSVQRMGSVLEQAFVQVLQLNQHFQWATSMGGGAYRQPAQSSQLFKFPAARGDARARQTERTALQFEVLDGAEQVLQQSAMAIEIRRVAA